MSLIAHLTELRNRKGAMSSWWVVSVYQDEQMFVDNTWWHIPITVGLRFQE